MNNEPTYGQEILAKLNELLSGNDKTNLTCTPDFWDWRKEFEARVKILNRAGLRLAKDSSGQWRADLSTVTAEKLDEAREYQAGQKERDRELKEMERRTLRAGDRARRRELERY